MFAIITASVFQALVRVTGDGIEPSFRWLDSSIDTVALVVIATLGAGIVIATVGRKVWATM